MNQEKEQQRTKQDTKTRGLRDAKGQPLGLIQHSQGRLLGLDPGRDEHVEQIQSGEAKIGIDAQKLADDIEALEVQGYPAEKILREVKLDLGVMLGRYNFTKSDGGDEG